MSPLAFIRADGMVRCQDGILCSRTRWGSFAGARGCLGISVIAHS